jgi:hypothetical protein
VFLSESGAGPVWSQILDVTITAAAIEAVGWALGVAARGQRSYLAAVRREAAREVHGDLRT